MGITINNTYLTEQLVSIVSTNGEELCNASSRCFLLDDGGFIIAESESAHPEGKSNVSYINVSHNYFVYKSLQAWMLFFSVDW